MSLLALRKLELGQLQTNCYLLSNKKTGQAIIIDPADDADYIIRIIEDNNLKPIKIIATHGHFDHVLAINELKLAYKIPFFLHKKDEFLLKYMRRSSKYFTGFDPGPAPKPDGFLKEGEILAHKLKIIHTPGHTPGSITLFNKSEKIAFVGDLIFSQGGIGRTDFSYSNKKDLEKSIQRILKFPEETIIYPGHGEKTTIGQFQRFYSSLLQNS